MPSGEISHRYRHVHHFSPPTTTTSEHVKKSADYQTFTGVYVPNTELDHWKRPAFLISRLVEAVFRYLSERSAVAGLCIGCKSERGAGSAADDRRAYLD
ncbi:unnamed protein product [Arctia plantaginis]|uniref:Uncharacterized protein n=1 Tax=Arctia plantaginis TaxID=874455 RepID=A0A8S1A9B8_ARCPL|nr:unnamed protein product [Arctia plantaginis]CAB3241991.1 unnamed protein product [Arctia plantaginis]